MAASMESMQAELDQIKASAEERAGLIKAGEDRAEFLDDPVNEFGHGITMGISNSLGIPVDVVNGVLNAVGIQVDAPLGSSDSIHDVMAEISGFPEGLEQEPTTIIEGGAEALGVAAVMTPAMLAPFMDAAFDPNLTDRQNAEYAKFKGSMPNEYPRGRAARAAFLLKQIGERIAKTAVENPKTFVASEAAAAFASGAAMEAAEQQGAGPGTMMAAGLGAGVVAGLSPSALPRMAKNAWRWGMKHFNPFRESGAMPRAQEQMQLRAEDPEGAAALVDDMIDPNTGKLKPEYEGLTPARVTGEERLMAQEARVLEDDAVLDMQVREDLTAAIKRAEGELRSLYGTPRGKQNWEQAVFQRVAPEGVEITPGTSEEMLDQLYKSFKPLYNQFKGWPIVPNLVGSRKTTLETMIANVPQSNRVMVEESTRIKVGRRLESMMDGLNRRLKNMKGAGDTKVWDSGDLLAFRSDLRGEARRASSRGDIESADLFRLAEEKVNALLKTQLKPEVLQELQVVDSNYRNYKIAEDAVYRGAAGDRGLTPDGLLSSLRASASSHGSYARGEQLELRSLAASGRPVAKLLNDPERLRRSVANMTDEDLLHTQEDFFETVLQKSMITDDDGLEVISGMKLKKTLQTLDESARAVRMDDDAIGRANEIADRLIMAQRRNPAAVAQLYEDGPADILQLLATLVGAKHGQKVAGRGMGSSLVLAGFFAKKAREMLAKLTSNQARIILAKAQTDPELYSKLLTTPTSERVFQDEATQYLKVYLANIAQRTAREAKQAEEPSTKEEYRLELERLRKEAEALGPNY